MKQRRNLQYVNNKHINMSSVMNTSIQSLTRKDSASEYRDIAVTKAYTKHKSKRCDRFKILTENIEHNRSTH